MGRTANYAVVYARLILPDASTGTKDYGVHPFLVQLRSLKDHSFVKGVTTGDIGAKFGTSGNDNGWLKMDHVRIPRDQMLMRFSKVHIEGNGKEKGWEERERKGKGKGQGKLSAICSVCMCVQCHVQFACEYNVKFNLHRCDNFAQCSHVYKC